MARRSCPIAVQRPRESRRRARRSCSDPPSQVHLGRSLVSLPPPHCFPLRRPWSRSDEMQPAVVRSRTARHGTGSASDESPGAEPVATSTAPPRGLPERGQFCHARSNRVRVMSWRSRPPRTISVFFRRSGRGHRCDHASRRRVPVRARARRRDRRCGGEYRRTRRRLTDPATASPFRIPIGPTRNRMSWIVSPECQTAAPPAAPACGTPPVLPDSVGWDTVTFNTPRRTSPSCVCRHWRLAHRRVPGVLQLLPGLEPPIAPHGEQLAQNLRQCSWALDGSGSTCSLNPMKPRIPTPSHGDVTDSTSGWIDDAFERLLRCASIRRRILLTRLRRSNRPVLCTGRRATCPRSDFRPADPRRE